MFDKILNKPLIQISMKAVRNCSNRNYGEFSRRITRHKKERLPLVLQSNPTSAKIAKLVLRNIAILQTNISYAIKEFF